jgi:hypothetical protein
MKRPSREEYERAVAVARAAIREAKGAPRIRADRSPQAVLVRMKAKAEKGEAPTEADFGAMVAALAEQESRNQRGRGRPKGARADGYRALRAAIWAVQESGLNPYRNGTGPRLSQCDAIADAMRAEGFRTLCSYDAARRELVAHGRARAHGFEPRKCKRSPRFRGDGPAIAGNGARHFKGARTSGAASAGSGAGWKGARGTYPRANNPSP